MYASCVFVRACAQLKDTVEEVQKTREEVFRDRQYEVSHCRPRVLCVVVTIVVIGNACRWTLWWFA